MNPPIDNSDNPSLDFNDDNGGSFMYVDAIIFETFGDIQQSARQIDIQQVIFIIQMTLFTIRRLKCSITCFLSHV